MKLTGHEAIAYAEANDLTLNKYTDPIEEAREGLTPDEARKIAREDPSLIWVDGAKTVDTVNEGEEVKLAYPASLAPVVEAIVAAGAEMQDGIVQAQDMARIVPMDGSLHTTMTEYSALVAVGCTALGA